MIAIPVSIGEIIDKLTILRIKLCNIHDPIKVQAVALQYSQILACLERCELVDQNSSAVKLKESNLKTDEDFLALNEINSQLWDLENRIRTMDAQGKYDKEFIKVARVIRHLNDQRAKVKKTIDQRFGSDFWDVKEHNRNFQH